ncbi:DUF6049 family protein [Microbacterium sp. AZCO]|uniref:DUF6049 family protein n=1 Tax=Microbacterium sp. AZCO TaxID=3142976 RepID=UPI0031F42613
MIQSPPPSVPRARRARASLAAVVGIVAALLAPVAAAPAEASLLPAATTPSPTPTPSAEPGEAVLTLSPISNGVLRDGDHLTASVTLANGTFEPTEPGTVTLAFGSERLTDRAELDAWLAGKIDDPALPQVASIPFLPVAAGESQTQGIAVDAPVTGLLPGVYPVRATLTTAGETFTSTSVVIVPDAAAPASNVGLVMPITADATADGLLTSDQLQELTGPEGSLTNQLDAVAGTDAILAVDPAIAAAIRVLGTAAPESATAWLARLETLPNTRFALQFGDADVASQVQAKIVPPLAPLSLQAYMEPANFTPAPGNPATPTPTPTTDPTAPIYPDNEQLLDIGTARAGVFWPATGTAGGDVVEGLGGVRVDDQQGLTLVTSTSTTAGADGGTVTARGADGDDPVLVYDAAISGELQSASTIDAAPLRGAHLAAATAYLSFALSDAGGAPLLVTVDRGEDRSRVALRTAISAVLEAPSVAPATLGSLANATPENVEVAGVDADAARVAAVSALVSGEDSLTQFATILDTPDTITGPERADILQLLGNAWRAQSDEWTTALATHREDTATTLDSVGILRASPIQLITSGAVIPVWVRNDLPYPVNVTLFATPDDLRLEVQRTTQVVAQPQSNSRVEVPVQAQIGSGDVTLSLELRSPTGVLIGDPQLREVHVRADWEGIGIIVLVVLAVGFVAVGVIRTILRRRGRKKGDAAPAAGGEPSTEPAGEADTAANADPTADSDPTEDADPTADADPTEDAEPPHDAEPEASIDPAPEEPRP